MGQNEKEVCGEKEDVYIGTVYKHNNANLQTLHETMDEIDFFPEKGGEVIFQGDFNARTNVDDN